MSPLQFAKVQCSNYQHDGSCLGVGIKDDGKLFGFGSKAKCVLGTPGIRCNFFEECVAPMAGRMATPRQNEEYSQAVRAYRLSANVQKSVKRACPECGRELEPRRQYCYICSARREKERNRERKRNNGV